MTVRRVVGLILVLGGAGFGVWAADAVGQERERYTVTIAEREAREVLAGTRTIAASDPNRCEKLRDLCLLAICGTTERENSQPVCWQECTGKAYARCSE